MLTIRIETEDTPACPLCGKLLEDDAFTLIEGIACCSYCTPGPEHIVKAALGAVMKDENCKKRLRRLGMIFYFPEEAKEVACSS